MKESRLQQMLRSRAYHRKWVVVFLVLALMVTAGVSAVLHKTGVAAVYTKRVLHCPYAELSGQVSHIHATDCYDADGNLVCPLQEIAPHMHTEECYTVLRDLVCGLEENPGHIHDDSCYTMTRGELLCTDESPDHEHTDACYEMIPTLSCGMEEGEGAHVHSDACYYEIQRTITCGLQELPEHVHDADCFIEVELTDEEKAALGLVDEEGELTAALDAAGEENLTEGSDEAINEAADEDAITPNPNESNPEEGNLEDGTADDSVTDETEEKTETPDSNSDEETGANIDEANPAESGSNGAEDIEKTKDEEPENEDTAAEETGAELVMPPASFEETAGDVRVIVEADEGVFPEGTTMTVEEVVENDVLDAVSGAVEGKVMQVKAVDITFKNANGEEIQPAKPIRVRMEPINGTEINDAAESAKTAENENFQVVHVDAAGKGEVVETPEELTEDEVITAETENAVFFDAEHFSVYAFVYTVVVDYEVDGQHYAASIDGADDMLLSDILQKLGGHYPIENVDTVYFTNPELVRVTRVEGDWSIRPMKDTTDEDALVVSTKDMKQFSIRIKTQGRTEADAGIAVISTVNETFLPKNAVASAEALDEARGEGAIAAVQSGGETLEADVEEPVAEEAQQADDARREETVYQVFDISLENVDPEDYKDGFRVALTLPANIIGRDFHLYHIHDAEVEELSFEKEAESTENGMEHVSSVQFETSSFSEFVLQYTVEYSYANYNYVIPVGEAVTLQSILDFIHYEVPSGVSVENVEFTGNPAEQGATQIIAIERSGDIWNLTANTNFSGDEDLIVTFSDGTTLTIAMYCEEKHIDAGYSYILYTQESDGVHVLKADGTTEVFSSLSDLGKNRLGPEYQWAFYFVFTQYDEGDHLDHVYYIVRPLSDKSQSIALNHSGADLVQTGANNIAVLPQGNIGEGGFIFHGYNNVEMGMNNGAFAGVTGSGSTVHIWQQDPLQTYEFTVVSDDYKMGSVTTTGTAMTKQAEVEQRQQNGTYTVVTQDVTYYIAETNTGKKNNAVITANPASHTNINGQNKWEFDYWDLDGEILYQKDADGNVLVDGNNNPIPLGSTINANTLEIPRHGSVLTAHFKQKNSNGYTVPDGEKQGSSFEDMTQWLQDMLSKKLPLDEEATKKTAEVYDYENRIYRVDLTTKASLTTFDGNIDLGFMLDVSNSMKFPSNLQPINGLSNVDIRAVNGGFWDGYWNQGQWINTEWHNADNSLNTSQTYYIISDPTHTSTVYKVEWRNGSWQYKDASADDSKYVRLQYPGVNNETTLFKENKDPTKDNNCHYQMYYDADPLHDRFFYLRESLANTWDALSDIQSVIQIASGDANPKIRIAYNTFNKYLNYNGNNADHPTGTDYGQDFAPVEANIQFSYSNGGGTRPDLAMNDAATKWTWGTGNRYAILITDGAPQGARTDLGEASNYTTEQIITNKVNPAALVLKAQGVKLITVGLSMDNVDGGRIMLYNLADDVNGKHMFFSAETGADLESILLQIVRTIMHDATVTGKVTDTVGDAFYIVDKNTGMPLKHNDKIDLDGNKLPDNYSGPNPYGVIQQDGCTIVWENQEFTHDGWQGTVYVKAKEDLLGGNAVMTNSGNANVEAQGYKMSEEQQTPTPFNTSLPEKLKTLTIDTLTSPRVNVNELGFLQNSTEWTVYLGTSVDPLTQIKKLWDEILVTEVVKDGHATDRNGDGLPDKGIAAADNNWYPLIANSIVDDREGEGAGDKQTFKMADLIKILAENGNYDWWDSTNHTPNWNTFLTKALTSDGIVIPYHVYGLNDKGKIKITLTKEIATDEEADLLGHSPHSTTVTGDGAEKYTLTVLYSPDYSVLPEGQGGSSTMDFQTGIYGTTYQGHAAGTETSRNNHVINVFAEPLDVLKVDDHDAAVPGATFSLYRAAKTGETGVPLSEYNDSLTGSYYCISTGTSGDDGVVHLAPDDTATPTHTVPVAAGQTAQNLLVPGETYYLIETTVPTGYKSENTVMTITVETGPELFTKLDKATPVGATDIDSTTGRPTIPYNWNEGVTFKVGELESSEDPVAAEMANHDTHQVITLPGGREYMLLSDSESSAIFQIKMLNTRVTSIDILKVGGNDSEGLSGAVFELKAVGADGHSWGDPPDIIGGIGTVTKIVNGATVTFENAFETTDDKHTLTDLPDGTYRLYEVYVPAGYVNTLQYIEFTISKHNLTLNTTSNQVKCVSAEGSTLALITIKNEPGVPLPMTGGIGSTIFTILGGLTTAIAGAALMMTRLRRKREDS